MVRDKVYPYEDAETTLVSLENHDGQDIDYYIGPKNESYGLEASPFMNPFNHSRKGYKGAVEHYKLYFYRRYLNEPDFKELAHELKGNRLAGWCYPRPSHGEVIIDLLDAHTEDGRDGVIEHIEEEIADIDKTELGVKGFREYEAAKEALEENK